MAGENERRSMIGLPPLPDGTVNSIDQHVWIEVYSFDDSVTVDITTAQEYGTIAPHYSMSSAKAIIEMI